MKKNYCTRKSMELLRKYIGNDGFRQMEVSNMLDWFLYYNKYIVAMPRANGKWTAWIVFTDKPNTIDGKLNMVDIEVNCKTKVDAEKAGIEFMLETMVDAKDKVATMTEEEKEKIRKSAIKEGWDISED